MKVKYTALLIMLISVGLAGSLQAQMTFQFSDNGAGTTLITASGSANLTGGQAAFGALVESIGWDDISTPGTNHSYYLVADSDFFTFNEPNVGGGVYSIYPLGRRPYCWRDSLGVFRDGRNRLARSVPLLCLEI